MFAKSGKKEIWLGTALEADEMGDPQLEISWGRLDSEGESRHRVVIPFEDFVDDILGSHERGGPNTGGDYDPGVVDILTRMMDILKFYRKYARTRLGT